MATSITLPPPSGLQCLELSGVSSGYLVEQDYKEIIKNYVAGDPPPLQSVVLVLPFDTSPHDVRGRSVHTCREPNNFDQSDLDLLHDFEAPNSAGCILAAFAKTRAPLEAAGDDCNEVNYASTDQPLVLTTSPTVCAAKGNATHQEIRINHPSWHDPNSWQDATEWEAAQPTSSFVVVQRCGHNSPAAEGDPFETMTGVVLVNSTTLSGGGQPFETSSHVIYEVQSNVTAIKLDSTQDWTEFTAISVHPSVEHYTNLIANYPGGFCQATLDPALACPLVPKLSTGPLSSRVVHLLDSANSGTLFGRTTCGSTGVGFHPEECVEREAGTNLSGETEHARNSGELCLTRILQVQGGDSISAPEHLDISVLEFNLAPSRFVAPSCTEIKASRAFGLIGTPQTWWDFKVPMAIVRVERLKFDPNVDQADQPYVPVIDCSNATTCESGGRSDSSNTDWEIFVFRGQVPVAWRQYNVGTGQPFNDTHLGTMNIDGDSSSSILHACTNGNNVDPGTSSGFASVVVMGPTALEALTDSAVTSIPSDLGSVDVGTYCKPFVQASEGFPVFDEEHFTHDTHQLGKIAVGFGAESTFYSTQTPFGACEPGFCGVACTMNQHMANTGITNPSHDCQRSAVVICDQYILTGQRLAEPNRTLDWLLSGETNGTLASVVVGSPINVVGYTFTPKESFILEFESNPDEPFWCPVENLWTGGNSPTKVPSLEDSVNDCSFAVVAGTEYKADFSEAPESVRIGFRYLAIRIPLDASGETLLRPSDVLWRPGHARACPVLDYVQPPTDSPTDGPTLEPNCSRHNHGCYGYYHPHRHITIYHWSSMGDHGNHQSWWDHGSDFGGGHGALWGWRIFAIVFAVSIVGCCVFAVYRNTPTPLVGSRTSLKSIRDGIRMTAYKTRVAPGSIFYRVD